MPASRKAVATFVEIRQPEMLSRLSVGTLPSYHPTNHCVTQVPCELHDLRAGDTILRCGCRGAIAGLIIVVTDVLGVVLEESDSN